MSVPRFNPERFRSAIAFYVAHRLRYPPRLVEAVADLTGLSSRGRVLDLGCGPGFLTLAFAERAAEAIGLDPDEAMLDAARREAAGKGAKAIFLRGSSFDLSPDLGRFDLVVMGRSFHWMDRAAVLDTLHRIVVPGGAIALFADEHVRTPENEWRGVVRQISDSFSAPDDDRRKRERPDWRSHVSILLDSAFPRVERHTVFERRAISADEIVGRTLSMSSTTPHVLGERRPAFEAALRAGLAPLAPDGRFAELVAFEATLAWR